MNKAFKRKGKLPFKKAYYWYWFDNRISKAMVSGISFSQNGIDFTPLGYVEWSVSCHG